MLSLLLRKNTWALLLSTLVSLSRSSSPWPESRWHLQRIVQRNKLSAREVSSGSSLFDLRSIPGRMVNVYVIDSGILINHEEFANERAIHGKNIRSPEKLPLDCDGHGTHVAATAVGALSGVATNARAISVKILNCKGRGSCSNVLSALEWVAKDSSHRRKQYGERSVAVMSIGSRSSDCAPTEKAAKVLWDSGVFIAAAAGNERGDACKMYPARSPFTVAVGAVDIEDKMYSRNNVGPCVDLFAPGVKILAGWGANSTTEFQRRSGSSMATPVVAGVAAIILSVNPNLTSYDVKEIITSSSTNGRLFDPEGNELLSSAPNKMIFAPWSKLFDELEIDDPNSSVHSTQFNKSEVYYINDQLWNSSTSFSAMALTFYPTARPAMLYSVIRIKRSLARVSGIREEAILARLAAGERNDTASQEPNVVQLVFYIPMMPEFVRIYQRRLVEAALSGELAAKSNETISFDESMNNTLRTNVSVPSSLAPVFSSYSVSAQDSPIRLWLRIALISVGCFAVVVLLFAGAIVVRTSMRNIGNKESVGGQPVARGGTSEKHNALEMCISSA